jgi:prepilin-type N-terminal cleavage/methylation domain-containing protein
MTYAAKRCAGFTFLELVIVIGIIGVLSAIAIPRIDRGSASAGESALSGDLAVLRNVIDLYAIEHANAFPAAVSFEAQLTLYTDIGGGTSITRTATHVYGPYLRNIPRLPVGSMKGKTTVAANPGKDVGWTYNAEDGTIRPNTSSTESDTYGKLYSNY